MGIFNFFKKITSVERAPILLASSRGDLGAVKQHLANGMDVNAKDEDGFTPLHQAALGGHKKIAELLIAKGADVNAKTKKAGQTPLHSSAFFGHKTVVELLIAKGADVNAKGSGTTPLDLAIINGETEIADLLRKHGGKTAEGK
jgi:cytohesin